MNLFCKEQKAASKTYSDNFEQIQWETYLEKEDLKPKPEDKKPDQKANDK